MNPFEIEEAVSNLALEPFDRSEFPFQFLAAFDNPDTTIKRLRSGSTNASDIPGGVLQRNNIHLATCAAGEVDAILKALRESPKTASNKAKFILATDGEVFQAEDLNGGGTVVCTYAEFPDHFGFFLPLAGITTVKEIQESSFDVKATGRLNRLYVQLLTENPDWATPARQHDMNHFMARLIFCFFAEDTDIFLTENLFTATVEQMTAGDASSTHTVISEIFRAMDTKPADREAAGLPRYSTKFPYVNGQLFSGSTEVPRFSKVARSYLFHIGGLNWRKINPDIFGSMIQAVTDDEERGSLGMHYTSVPNILKVLNPLFLDDLQEKLAEAGGNARKLLNLRTRMARIRVFDPACGSGNFLVIAYKAMREIEAEINRRRGEPDRRSDIPLTNFRGIELRDFPAEIARLALIIAEYQCDVLYRGQKDAISEFLPLGSENWITSGNALQLDWLAICRPVGTGVKVTSDDLFQTPLDQAEIDFANDGGETYLCGNPPYQGSVNQDAEQKADMARIFARYLPAYKDLDYVAAWIVRACEYLRSSPTSCAAFVTTNSVVQGEQVAMLWPIVFGLGKKIVFAHTDFKWNNNAANNAGVTCVIVGIGSDRANKKIVSGLESRRVENISPYLTASDDVVVRKRTLPLSHNLSMQSGNKPTDNGNFILSRSEVENAVSSDGRVASFVRPYKGSRELIQGSLRWCLWFDDSRLSEALEVPFLSKRIENVRAFRSSSSGKQANDNAAKAHRFVFAPHRSGGALAVANVSSEAREYIPCDYIDDRTIVSNLASVIYEAPTWSLAIVASRVHYVWISTICGKLETRLRYSNTLGWNTFPLPALTAQNKTDLTRCAESILLAREAHFPATIADLYDPEKMPDDLRRAHDANDEVLERIYIGRRFRNDTERLEKLFELYTRMTTKPGGPKRATVQ